MNQQDYSASTLCVHAGTLADKATGGVNTPVYSSSAIDFRTERGVIYPRYFNTPNHRSVALKIAALEHADTALVLSSGMAAISTGILALVPAGSSVVFQPYLYGGTMNFIRAELEKRGIKPIFAQSTKPEDFRAAIRPDTKMIYAETPANPLLGITDIGALGQIAREQGILLMTDNTFATPVNQNPLDLGAHIVMHSATKYLCGHSDLVAGILAGSHQIIEECRSFAMIYGTSLNASEYSLLERSMKTLALRVEKHNENALHIAKWLDAHPAVETVFYPGLATHSGHEIACAQMHGGFGGMLSFSLYPDYPRSSAEILRRLRMICPAGSLGGVESLITLPAHTSHKGLSEAEKKEWGISDRLFRLSLGIEHYKDIQCDLEQAIG
jgi:cystathionine beta-lyase